MGTVRFNGGSFKWTVTASSALSFVSSSGGTDGACTCAFAIKRAVDNAAYHGLGYLLSGTVNGTTEFGMSISGSPNEDAMVADLDGESVLVAPSLTITGTTEYYIVVARKAAGTSVITFTRYIKSTDTWSAHTDSANTHGDQTAATMLELGAWETGDNFNGWMAAAAFWEGRMSDANVTALSTGWKTSTWWNSAHGQPKFLVELNTATPADLANAGAGTRSTTGTAPTLDTGETFSSWSYDGTGTVATSLVLTPNAYMYPMLVR